MVHKSAARRSETGYYPPAPAISILDGEYDPGPQAVTFQDGQQNFPRLASPSCQGTSKRFTFSQAAAEGFHAGNNTRSRGVQVKNGFDAWNQLINSPILNPDEQGIWWNAGEKALSDKSLLDELRTAVSSTKSELGETLDFAAVVLSHTSGLRDKLEKMPIIHDKRPDLYATYYIGLARKVMDDLARWLDDVPTCLALYHVRLIRSAKEIKAAHTRAEVAERKLAGLAKVNAVLYSGPNSKKVAPRDAFAKTGSGSALVKSSSAVSALQVKDDATRQNDEIDRLKLLVKNLSTAILDAEKEWSVHPIQNEVTLLLEAVGISFTGNEPSESIPEESVANVSDAKLGFDRRTVQRFVQDSIKPLEDIQARVEGVMGNKYIGEVIEFLRGIAFAQKADDLPIYLAGLSEQSNIADKPVVRAKPEKCMTRRETYDIAEYFESSDEIDPAEEAQHDSLAGLPCPHTEPLDARAVQEPERRATRVHRKVQKATLRRHQTVSTIPEAVASTAKTSVKVALQKPAEAVSSASLPTLTEKRSTAQPDTGSDPIGKPRAQATASDQSVTQSIANPIGKSMAGNPIDSPICPTSDQMSESMAQPAAPVVKQAFGPAKTGSIVKPGTAPTGAIAQRNTPFEVQPMYPNERGQDAFWADSAIAHSQSMDCPDFGGESGYDRPVTAFSPDYVTAQAKAYGAVSLYRAICSVDDVRLRTTILRALEPYRYHLLNATICIVCRFCRRQMNPNDTSYIVETSPRREEPVKAKEELVSDAPFQVHHIAKGAEGDEKSLVIGTERFNEKRKGALPSVLKNAARCRGCVHSAAGSRPHTSLRDYISCHAGKLVRPSNLMKSEKIESEKRHRNAQL